MCALLLKTRRSVAGAYGKCNKKLVVCVERGIRAGDGNFVLRFTGVRTVSYITEELYIERSSPAPNIGSLHGPVIRL